MDQDIGNVIRRVIPAASEKDARAFAAVAQQVASLVNRQPADADARLRVRF